MPPTKATGTLLRKWITGYTDILRADNSVILCTICVRSLNATRHHHVKQHITSATHEANAQRKKKAKQSLLTKSKISSDFTGDGFKKDLCYALLSAGISWHKVNNPALKKFLEKYTSRKIPDESSLRKGYLDLRYTETIQCIREDLVGPVWIGVDETTDVEGRYMAHVIVGRLDPGQASALHLLVCRQLDATNDRTIGRLVNDAMALLWPGGVEYNRVALLVSDAAQYMIKAGKNLAVFFPNMLHVTCLAHALHRVAETIRGSSEHANSIVSSVRKIFVKAPKRIALYNEVNPGLKLPPEPVLTRWGTWLDTVNFHAENFTGVAKAVEALDPKESALIAKAQLSLKNPQLSQELAYLKAHFGFLPEAITSLEKRGRPMKETLEILNSVKSRIQDVPGGIGKAVKEKLEAVLRKNLGLQAVMDINAVLNGKEPCHPVSFDPVLLSSFNYAPLTSVKVERSFSLYKNVLSEHRRRLTPANLEKILVIQCEHSMKM